LRWPIAALWPRARLQKFLRLDRLLDRLLDHLKGILKRRPDASAASLLPDRALNVATDATPPPARHLSCFWFCWLFT
jgi:hypothetical protein